MPLGPATMEPRKRKVACAWDTLPEAIQTEILRRVALQTSSWHHALVCRRWLSAPVALSIPRGALLFEDDILGLVASLRSLSLRHNGSCTGLVQLRIGENSVWKLTDQFLFSLAATCPELQSLHVARPRRTAADNSIISSSNGPSSDGSSSNNDPSRMSSSNTRNSSSPSSSRSSGPSRSSAALAISASSSLFPSFAALQALFEGCTKLQNLHLDLPSLHTVPQAISVLASLDHLALLPPPPIAYSNSVAESSGQASLPPHCRGPLVPALGHLARAPLRELELTTAESAGLGCALGGLRGLRSLRLRCTSRAPTPGRGTLEFLGGLRQLEDLHLDFASPVEGELGRGPVLPECLSALTALSSLETSNVAIVRFPTFVRGGFESLRRLRLVRPGCAVLPDEVWRQARLESLCLSCDALQSIPEALGQLECLTDLVLEAAQVAVLPQSLASLAGLTRLEVKGHHIAHSLEGILQGLPNLQVLRCSPFSDISGRAIAGLKRLTSLTADQCAAEPPTVTVAPSLPSLGHGSSRSSRSSASSAGAGVRELQLRCSLRGRRPRPFPTLDQLLHLSLSTDGEAAPFPTLDFTQFLGLRSLVLNRVAGELPPSVGSLQALESLTIRCCTLRALPESFGQLGQLKELRLEELPEIDGLCSSFQNLHSLQDLTLSKLPQLKSLSPHSFAKMEHLLQLTVEGCPRLEAASEDSTLPMLLPPSLRVLCLCGIPHVPLFLGNLLSLVALEITRCGLGAVPDEIGNLRGLRSLVLGELPLVTALPETMTQLSAVRELAIEPWEGLRAIPPGLRLLPCLSQESRDRLAALERAIACKNV